MNAERRPVGRRLFLNEVTISRLHRLINLSQT